MTNDPILNKLNAAILALKGRQERVEVEITDPNCPHKHLICTGKVAEERSHLLWQCGGNDGCGSTFSYPVSIAENGFRNYKQRNISETLDNVK